MGDRCFTGKMKIRIRQFLHSQSLPSELKSPRTGRITPTKFGGFGSLSAVVREIDTIMLSSESWLKPEEPATRQDLFVKSGFQTIQWTPNSWEE